MNASTMTRLATDNCRLHVSRSLCTRVTACVCGCVCACGPVAVGTRAVHVNDGFQLSHGKVLTATACQGRTFHQGVIIDCGRIAVGPRAKTDEERVGG